MPLAILKRAEPIKSADSLPFDLPHDQTRETYAAYALGTGEGRAEEAFEVKEDQEAAKAISKFLSTTEERSQIFYSVNCKCCSKQGAACTRNSQRLREGEHSFETEPFYELQSGRTFLPACLAGPLASLKRVANALHH
jgi:hypothetical protein